MNVSSVEESTKRLRGARSVCRSWLSQAQRDKKSEEKCSWAMRVIYLVVLVTAV